MIILIVVGFLTLAQTRAFSPVSSLADCPKVVPDNNVKLDKVVGTWRLAYLYIDDVNDIEEDNSCGVAEIMQVNETKMGILLYIDNRKDEMTLDRYTKEFEVTVLSPGEWVLYTSFKYLEFIHVTVMGLFGDHLFLTFCAAPFSSENSAKPGSYDPSSNAAEKESVNDIFNVPRYQKLVKDFGNQNLIPEHNRSLKQREESFFRGKRYAIDRNSESDSDTYKKFLTKRLNKVAKKHLWTAILVRNNKVSALEYIENASYLMKYGYNISKGQLISFGTCALNK